MNFPKGAGETAATCIAYAMDDLVDRFAAIRQEDRGPTHSQVTKGRLRRFPKQASEAGHEYGSTKTSDLRQALYRVRQFWTGDHLCKGACDLWVS